MDVIIMPLIAKIRANLEQDYPMFQFVTGDTTAWNPTTQTVHYNPTERHAAANLLHELSHAQLQHNTYQTGVELLRQEAEAWAHAMEIAARYSVTIPTGLVEAAIDTYRDWLHVRSSCPACGALGIEAKSAHYSCFSCHHQWRVNDGRSAHIRRYSTS